MGTHDDEDQPKGKEQDTDMAPDANHEIDDEEELDTDLMKIVAMRATGSGHVPDQEFSTETPAAPVIALSKEEPPPEEKEATATGGEVMLDGRRGPTNGTTRTSGADDEEEIDVDDVVLDFHGVPGAHNVVPRRFSEDGVEEEPTGASGGIPNTGNNNSQGMTPLDATLVVPREHRANAASQPEPDPEQALPVHHATPVSEEENDQQKLSWQVPAVLVMLVVIVLLVLGISGVFGGNSQGSEDEKATSTTDGAIAGTISDMPTGNFSASDSTSIVSLSDNSTDLVVVAPIQTLPPNVKRKPTLESIQERGYLRCADITVPFSGFIHTDEETGRKSGFYGELASTHSRLMHLILFLPMANHSSSYCMIVQCHRCSTQCGTSVPSFGRGMGLLSSAGGQS